MKDDRGQKFKLISLRKVAKAETDASVEAKKVADMIRQGVASSTQSTSRKTDLGCLAIIAAVVLILAILWLISPELLALAIRTLWLICCFAIPISLFVFPYLSQRTTIAHTLVSHGICPSCTYMIHGLPADEQGCVACPECGIAWLESRITTPFTGEISENKPFNFFKLTLNHPDRVPSTHRVCVDHAQRYVQIFKAHKFPAAVNRRGNTGDSDRLTAILEKCQAIQKRRIRALLIVTLNICGLALIYIYRTNEVQSTVGICAFLAVNVFVGFINRSPDVIKIFLTQSICPGCGHDLVNQPLHESGYTVCPQCHAAWDLSRYNDSPT